MALLPHLRRAVARRRLIASGDRGAVALSGGPDSLSLLHVLLRLSRERSFSLEAVHVDHGLRQESAAEAVHVQELGRSLGVAVSVVKAVLGAGNVQAQAREQRLELLGRHAISRGLDWIALGHTASDQAETVLMRAVRGTGGRGLGGMAWRRGIIEAPVHPPRPPWLIRPLLDRTRAEVEAYVEQHALQPLEDPSNATDRYLRNRIRRRVMPLLSAENPRVVHALSRLAETCREEDQALDLLAAQHFERAWSEGGLQLRALSGVSSGLLARVLRKAHQAAVSRRSAAGLERQHLVAVLDLCEELHGSRGLDLPGARVERRYDRLCWRVDPPAAAPPFEPATIPGSGRYPLSDGRTLLVERAEPGQGLDRPLTTAGLRFPLLLRSPRAGDRIKTGATVTRKVARVLMDAKIPRDQRSHVPLLINGDGRVLQIVGIRQRFGRGAASGEQGLLVRLAGGGAEEEINL